MTAGAMAILKHVRSQPDAPARAVALRMYRRMREVGFFPMLVEVFAISALEAAQAADEIR